VGKFIVNIAEEVVKSVSRQAGERAWLKFPTKHLEADISRDTAPSSTLETVLFWCALRVLETPKTLERPIF
jgi:hypothetical protein